MFKSIARKFTLGFFTGLGIEAGTYAWKNGIVKGLGKLKQRRINKKRRLESQD